LKLKIRVFDYIIDFNIQFYYSTYLQNVTKHKLTFAQNRLIFYTFLSRNDFTELIN